MSEERRGFTVLLKRQITGCSLALEWEKWIVVLPLQVTISI